jgi:hypothetical protein
MSTARLAPTHPDYIQPTNSNLGKLKEAWRDACNEANYPVDQSPPEDDHRVMLKVSALTGWSVEAFRDSLESVVADNFQ